MTVKYKEHYPSKHQWTVNYTLSTGKTFVTNARESFGIIPITNTYVMGKSVKRNRAIQRKVVAQSS